uniref:Mutator-like transposase domain-containing protein n=1 Tax=Culex tarsalis TaxID=7177 RepID=A0A1Q3EZ24_CULTA
MMTRRKSIHESLVTQQQNQNKPKEGQPEGADGRKTPGPGKQMQPRKRINQRRVSEAAPGTLQNGANGHHAPANGLDADDIPKFKGYRIIEIDHFLQWSAYSQFMHSKHCPGGLLKPYQEYVSGCYSTFAMKCSKCSAIITRSSENYIHHNKLMNRLVKGSVAMGKDYDEMSNFMESLEIPFVTKDEFSSIKSQMQLNSSLDDQSSLQKAVEELERASVASKRKRHGSCKYHYEVLKVYLNKKMRKIEENLQLSVNDSVALAVNAHLKNVSHVQLAPTSPNNATAGTSGTSSSSSSHASSSSQSNRFGAGFSNGPPTTSGNLFIQHQ